ATDGQRVYAIFANGDVVCFDFDGGQIWARSVGPLNNMYGHASSLVIHRNLLLIQLDQARTEDKLSKLMAIEATSGRTVWEKQRPVPDSWATPIVINTGGREEIITCGNPWVIAYAPTTGEELWRVKCLSGDVAPSPVYSKGLVYVINAYELLIAIRPGG
ncbi:MAG: outer membrane protein assembly factor BamB family protein, partial [Planctomycetota bacterium]